MEMEEMMMTMMISRRTPENPRIESVSNDPNITTSSTNCPTWKLYENPFYANTPHNQTQWHHPENQNHHHQQSSCSLELENKASSDQPKQIHRLQLPISARKIAASFWDLTFIKPLMESELDVTRAKITELKAELEQERKARKKAESLNKKLARELSEVKKGREAVEQLCEKLVKEVSSDKAEMDRMHKDMEEERKMLRVAEVLREERVQMKLADAKLLLEERLTELEATTKSKEMPPQTKITPEAQQNRHNIISNAGVTCNANISRGGDRSSGEEIKS